MRPLPSVNGWMDSNWACAIAACARIGRSVRAEPERETLPDSGGAHGQRRHHRTDPHRQRGPTHPRGISHDSHLTPRRVHV